MRRAVVSTFSWPSQTWLPQMVGTQIAEFLR
jgi:hypothetical protein